MSELFSGQYRTTYTCNKCNDKTIRFETYTYLQLPLEVSTNIKLTIIVNQADSPVYTRMSVSISKFAKLFELHEALMNII